MGSVQQSSMVSAVGAALPPLRTGYEQLIGTRADDRFANMAKQDGVVVSVSESVMEVKLKDGSLVGVDVGIQHGKASGVTLPHNIVSDLPVGAKFKAGDALAWNDGYFKRDILNPNGVSMVGGVMSRVVLIENTDTLEDGCAMSDRMVGDLSTPVSKAKTIIVPFTQAVKLLIRAGDTVALDTVLMTIEEGDLSGLSDDDALLGLIKLTGKAPKAKVRGTVSKIETLYMGEIADMHPSLQSVVRTGNKARKAHDTAVSKTGVHTGQVYEPTFVNGSELIANTVAITLYIDSMDTLGVGDKSVIDHALKTVVSRIMTGENTTEDGQAIDIIFSYTSINNRVVPHTITTGVTNTALMALGEKVVAVYRGG